MKDLNDVFAKGVINQALSGKITNAVAASRLGISVRYVKKLKARLRASPSSGLAHGNKRQVARPCSPTYRCIKERLGFKNIVVDFLPIMPDFVEEAYAMEYLEDGTESVHSFGQWNYPVRALDGTELYLDDTHSEIDLFELFGPAQDEESTNAIIALYKSQFGEELHSVLSFMHSIKLRKQNEQKNTDFLKAFEKNS